MRFKIGNFGLLPFMTSSFLIIIQLQFIQLDGPKVFLILLVLVLNEKLGTSGEDVVLDWVQSQLIPTIELHCNRIRNSGNNIESVFLSINF